MSMTRTTSAEAYRKAQEAGALVGKQQQIVCWISELGRAPTSGEVLAEHGIRNVNAWRARFTELSIRGAIRPAGRRRCAISGLQAITWEVAPWPWTAPPPRVSTRDLLERALATLETIPDLTARAEAAAIREELAR